MAASVPRAVILLALASGARAQTTCRVYCPNGTSFIQDCNSNFDPRVSRGERRDPGEIRLDPRDPRRIALLNAIP